MLNISLLKQEWSTNYDKYFMRKMLGKTRDEMNSTKKMPPDLGEHTRQQGGQRVHLAPEPIFVEFI